MAIVKLIDPNICYAEDIWIYEGSKPYEYFAVDRDSISSLRGSSPYAHYFSGFIKRNKEGQVFFVIEEREDECLLNTIRSGLFSQKVYEAGGGEDDNVIHEESNMIADRQDISKNKFRLYVNNFVCFHTGSLKGLGFKKLDQGEIRDKNQKYLISHLKSDEQMWINIIKETPRDDSNAGDSQEESVLD